jgi:glutamate 5-kinase
VVKIGSSLLVEAGSDALRTEWLASLAPTSRGSRRGGRM